MRQYRELPRHKEKRRWYFKITSQPPLGKIPNPYGRLTLQLESVQKGAFQIHRCVYKDRKNRLIKPVFLIKSPTLSKYQKEIDATAYRGIIAPSPYDKT